MSLVIKGKSNYKTELFLDGLKTIVGGMECTELSNCSGEDNFRLVYLFRKNEDREKVCYYIKGFNCSIDSDCSIARYWNS